jgi:hypothetical protein
LESEVRLKWELAHYPPRGVSRDALAAAWRYRDWLQRQEWVRVLKLGREWEEGMADAEWRMRVYDLLTDAQGCKWDSLKFRWESYREFQRALRGRALPAAVPLSACEDRSGW